MLNLPGFTISEVLQSDETGWLARAERHQQRVLVRMPREDFPSLEELARLKYGYELSAGLDIPGIVKVLDLTRHGNSVILAMDDFGGVPLRAYQAQASGSIKGVLEIGIQLAKVVGELHRRRIIHKNIHPASILVHPRTRETRLFNFDIASRLNVENPDFISPEQLDGNLAYISPEQTGRMNRSLDYRTDLYSLGVTLYELLTGQLPFQATDMMALVYSHLAITPAPPHLLRPEIPRALSAVVMKLLAKNADDRYQSAYGLSMDLKLCLDQLASIGTIADFLPGEQDVSATFHIPQKLYGREADASRLDEAFNRVCQSGRTELLLVTGYSGVGKSSLVHEVHLPLVRQRGYYGAGKYDQLQNAPYAAWIQAFDGLIRQLLAESEERIASWRQRLQAALGENGRVVTDLVPQLELIIGPQPPVPALLATESQNRFNLVFQQLVACCASAEHPLVLFLDDLQWADAASLFLLQRVVADPGIRSLLVIGAYRDNEVRAGHALLPVLGELRKEAAVNEIALSPLGVDSAQQLIADTVDRPVEEVADLAQLVFKKTQGNPFFLGQFVRSLNARGLLTFDPERGRWQWDLEQIQGESITDNVADLMAERIASLPEATREALKHASCIGNKFSLDVLAAISGQGPEETALALWDAVLTGLLLPIGNAYKYVQNSSAWPASAAPSEARYEFLHDRVQEAAYCLMTKDVSQRHHLRIGRLLLKNTPEDQRPAVIFDIVNQLNQAEELIESLDEREELARLNLLAGIRAKASTAYVAALKYLRVSTRLLPDSIWERQYGLALALHKNLSESHFLVGQFEDAEKGFRLVLERAKSPEQKHEIYHLMIELFVSRGQYIQVIQPALEGLKVLGLELPEDKEAIAAATAQEKAKLEADRAARPISSLAELPEATDPLERARILLFSQALSYAAYTHQHLFALMSPMALNRAREHGHAPGSATSYVMYALGHGPSTGDYAQAHEYGRLALTLAEKVGGRSEPPLVQFIFAAYPNPWCRPIETSLRLLDQAFQGCLANNMLVWASQCSLHFGVLGQLGKEDLETQHARLQRHVDFYRRSGAQYLWAIHQIRVSQRSILRLMDAAPPSDGLAWQSEDELVEKLDNPTVLSTAYIMWMRTAFLMDDLVEARNYLRKAEPRLGLAYGWITQAEFQFYQGLLLAALHAKATAEEKAEYEKVLADNIEKFQCYRKLCAENFQQKHLLLLAEQARLSGAEGQAMALYDEAIEAAARAELSQDEALANELAARFYLAQGRKRVARTYLEDAHHAYGRWGARGKVSALERQYPELLGADTAAAQVASTAGETLDLSTVLKASQAISGEIVLQELLEKLMRISLENAGAQRGLLLLKGDVPLVVEGQLGEDGATEVKVRNATQDLPSDMPATIVRYVERTGERVVLREATREGHFQTDSYIAGQRPRSVLCLQVMKQKQPVGTLYLENRLVAGAFTPKRCRLLEVLSAQAAISLENARLYDTLDQRVRERTRELRASNEELSHTLKQLKQMQAQLVMKEKLASLGALTSGVAHELKNPLNFIKNFALLSVDLAQELQQQLADPEALKNPLDVDALTEISTSLKENAAHISEHSSRADSIVHSMLELSRTGRGGPMAEVDLHDLLKHSVELARQEFRMVNPSFEVAVQTHFDGELPPVEVMPQALGRALLNLVNNACYAIEARRKKGEAGFVPELTVRTRNLGNGVEIRIRDNGTGIPESIRGKIFNPFFTSKPTGQGTGLGLAIGHDIIVQGHGGTLDFTTEEWKYTEFVVTLPRRSPSSTPPGESD
ncbi:trifunctional serine/threonine-protein kinase/ATP-binding protein/sensor histidine kinase [Stigmatella aurantiaca]|uniref:histidine kinase n=2 Tax=Stigmatella aurantiaca TaxID=41 RepID=Q09D69_STIAD|nr:AAA family ATPase [Stigmatella aurantiaca]ADO67837.1 sensor protein, serine/threonine protein kinase [Stigmatella aurantiaca DW4/3-1]EAU69700.1 serine/threonine kinase with two-component sensor domain [Stigmatella aurantiaca DW4/3-1]